MIEPRDRYALVSSFSEWRGQHWVDRQGEVGRTGRGRRAGQRYGTDSLGTCEILRATNSLRPYGMGRYKQGHTLRLSPLQGNKPGDEELGRGSEQISDLVFGAGSLRAPIVLRTPGNTAQVDPVEGRGAPLYRVFLRNTEVL